MNVLVAIFSYNRPSLLQFTTRHLWKSLPRLQDQGSQIAIFDDDSDDPKVLEYLQHCISKGCYVSTPGRSNPEPRGNYHERARRLAVLRQFVVDFFLETSTFDYLLLKDDDILTNWSAILEAIKDFEYLKTTDWARIGALTLHGLKTHSGFLQVDGKVFAELGYTGEANVLFSKEALLQVGNHFAPVAKGFADLQFQALQASGLKYYDRVWPTYEVQHLGIGPRSSSVHLDEITPGWTTRPYRCVYTRRDMDEPLRVGGFNVQVFAEAAGRLGAEKAIQAFLPERSK